MEITSFHIQLAIVIMVIYYLLFIQFEVNNIILDIDKEELKIRFPISFFLREKTYDLKDITKVHFKYSPGPYGTPKFFVWTNGGKRFKHYIPNDIEELAEELKERQIEVEID